MVAVTKLRIKFGSEGAHRTFQQQPVISQCSYANKTEWPTGEDSFSANSKKRGPQELAECQPKKKLKMDRNVSRQCYLLLKSLMEHRHGWIFNQPVDPVKLNIPDYFSVISNPMDLGTIKSKLTKNVYSGVDEFAVDVRLTFSNAMLYNPPANYVHQMAKDLNELFEAKWESLEKKWNPEVSRREAAGGFGRQSPELYEPGQSRPETPAFSECSAVTLSKPVEEKIGKISLSVRSMALTTKLKLLKPDQRHFGTSLTGKSSFKGTDSVGRHDHVLTDTNRSPSLAAIKCGSCGKTTCTCVNSGHSSYPCLSDVTWETSYRDNGSDATSMTDCRTKSTSGSQTGKSDPDSDGAVSSMNEENVCPSSQPVNNAASDEGLKTPIVEVPLSPKKALRAAMLKSRFADTILKAKQRTLLDHSNKVDPMKIQQEKEQLERMHREEKARIEAEIRAAEVATRIKEEAELKMQRERQREAARLALQKVEEAAEREENHLKVERELERLCGSDVVREANRGARLLEKLGLFMKDDDYVEEIEASVLRVDGEEGEIF